MKSENHREAKLAVVLILLSAFGIGACIGIGTWWSRIVASGFGLLILAWIGFIMIGLDDD